MALFSGREVAKRIQEYRPDALHVATEGPLGLAARRYAVKHGLNFTTAYHTMFPEYLQARTGTPAACFYPWMRWFHRPSKAIMVSTDSVIAQLQEKGFANLVKWGRGVDLALFKPAGKAGLTQAVLSLKLHTSRTTQMAHSGRRALHT